jgi:hypothetical protein
MGWAQPAALETRETHLITSFPSRRLTAILAVALSMVAIVVLLALSGQARADTHNAACSSAHSRHGARACAQSKHASSSHKGKVKGKGHHPKHAAKSKGAAKKKAATKGKLKLPAGTIKTPAICEDGSTPVRESDGFFSCDDESEPGCENGSTPMLSSNGRSLVCGPAPKGSSLTEAACEDGSTPNLAADGSFSCDDESEPSCENGSEPILSSDSSHLLCNVSTYEKSAGSEKNAG